MCACEVRIPSTVVRSSCCQQGVHVQQQTDVGVALLLRRNCNTASPTLYEETEVIQKHPKNKSSTIYCSTIKFGGALNCSYVSKKRFVVCTVVMGMTLRFCSKHTNTYSLR